MADRYIYGAVSSPSSGEMIRRQLAAGDRALMGGFTRASGSIDIDASGGISLSPNSGQNISCAAPLLERRFSERNKTMDPAQ